MQLMKTTNNDYETYQSSRDDHEASSNHENTDSLILEEMDRLYAQRQENSMIEIEEERLQEDDDNEEGEKDCDDEAFHGFRQYLSLASNAMAGSQMAAASMARVGMAGIGTGNIGMADVGIAGIDMAGITMAGVTLAGFGTAFAEPSGTPTSHSETSRSFTNIPTVSTMMAGIDSSHSGMAGILPDSFRNCPMEPIKDTLNNHYV